MRSWICMAVVAAGGCFTPAVQPCAIECAARLCPPGTSCLDDGFCHEPGDTDMCPRPPDAAPDDAPIPDAAPCLTECGNGDIETGLGESCDDANCVADDGCSAVCEIEPRFVCDGTPSSCRRQPEAVGDVLITEIFHNPAGTETTREWFELHNPTATPWDLQGVQVADAGSDTFTVSMSLPLEPGGSVVLASSGIPEANDGLAPDFVYNPGMFTLANDIDEVRVFPAGGTIAMDQVDYDTSEFPDSIGRSMSLDPADYDPAANDDSRAWCDGEPPYGDGDGFGTPGALNPRCL